MASVILLCIFNYSTVSMALKAIDHSKYPLFYKAFFTEDHSRTNDKGGTYHFCNLCPGARSLMASRGTSLGSSGNLAKHVRSVHHQTWEEEYDRFVLRAERKESHAIDQFFTRSVPDKAKNLFHWVQWIVMCDLPPSIVENECYRLNTEKTRMNVRIKVPLDSPMSTSICDCWQIDVEW